MKKYLVSVYYTGSVDFEVEAESPDEAEEKALAIELAPDEFQQRLSGSLEHCDVFVREE